MYISPTDASFIIKPPRSLILPTILPDEFMLGYLGRVVKVNDFNSILNIKKILRNWFREAKPKMTMPPFVELLAYAMGCETSSIVKQHTFTSVLRTTRPDTIKFPAELGSSNTDESGIIKNLSLINPKSLACFCEACVIEDMKYQGFSIWRRSHQFPGIDWCLKHLEALKEVPDRSAFNIQPGIYFSNGDYFKQSESLGINDQSILRFAQLIEDALELDVPVNNWVAQDVLKNKASSLGIKFSEAGESRQLTDLMNEKLPEPWVIKFFPKLKKKSSGKFLAGFDEVLKSSRKGKSYINTLLAAAVLFDDADEAMYQLTTQNYHLLSQNNKQEISDITFISAYVRHQGSYSKMGTELEKDRRYIFSRARWLGLPSMTGVSTETFKAIKDFYDGVDLSEILTRSSVNKEKFANIIRLSGRLFSNKIKKIDSID